MKVVSFHTGLGNMALAFRDNSLAALVFGYPTRTGALRAVEKVLPGFERFDGEQVESDLVVDEIIERLQAFAEGEAVDLSDVPIDTSHATSFQRRVLQACRRIPWGATTTYGALATKVGRPGAARAVGSVMAGNRVPLVIPCHRVVPATGGLGGFSAPQGVKMKRRLLDAERSLALC